MRPPYWVDFALVAMSALIAGALCAIPTVLLSVRNIVNGQELRRLLLSFIMFLYSLCGLVILMIIGRIAYVTTEVRLVLRGFLIAQLVVYAAAAILSLWLIVVVLRPAFKHSVKQCLEPDDKEPFER